MYQLGAPAVGFCDHPAHKDMWVMRGKWLGGLHLKVFSQISLTGYFRVALESIAAPPSLRARWTKVYLDEDRGPMIGMHYDQCSVWISRFGTTQLCSCCYETDILWQKLFNNISQKSPLSCGQYLKQTENGMNPPTHFQPLSSIQRIPLKLVS